MTIDAASFDRDVTIFCGLPNIVSYNYRMHRVLMNSVSTILRSTDIVKAKDSDLLNSLIGQSDSEAQSFSVLDDDDLSECAPIAFHDIFLWYPLKHMSYNCYS